MISYSINFTNSLNSAQILRVYVGSVFKFAIL